MRLKITSKNPIKKAVVATFKAEVEGCRKVTNVTQTGENEFTAHCMGKSDATDRWCRFKSLGDHTITLKV